METHTPRSCNKPPDRTLAYFVALALWLVGLWIWVRVDPEYEDLGIGTWLLHWAEQRVLQVLHSLPAELRFAPRVSTYYEAQKFKQMLDDMDYQYIRSSYHMLIEMDGPVPVAEFPEGITLRTYNPGIDAEAAYRAQIDSFRDHFGFVEGPFEEGLKRFKHVWEDESSDPSLMFLAMDGEEVAGINLCRPQSLEDLESGWVE